MENLACCSSLAESKYLTLGYQVTFQPKLQIKQIASLAAKSIYHTKVIFILSIIVFHFHRMFLFSSSLFFYVFPIEICPTINHFDIECFCFLISSDPSPWLFENNR